MKHLNEDKIANSSAWMTTALMTFIIVKSNINYKGLVYTENLASDYSIPCIEYNLILKCFYPIKLEKIKNIII